MSSPEGFICQAYLNGHGPASMHKYSQPAAYSKPCACPEDRDSAGRRCGKRSAWSKEGGASPMCNADGTRA
jgi:hypothetical protein